MNPIKLLDVANPKKIKDTVNLLIENYENFGDTVQAIADKAAEDSAAALIAGEAAKQIAEESAEALEEAIASQNTTIENAIAAQDVIIAQNTTTSNSAKQIAEEALVMIEQADARSEAATETAEDALGLANEAISTSELAMNVATEAKSTVDQAISTGVFGTFVHNTAGISLLHAYMTDNLNQENTDENFYMATPKLVRDALSNISAGNLLIGTEENPIILSTDIEEGKSYFLGGYYKNYPQDSTIYNIAGNKLVECSGIGINPSGSHIIHVKGCSLSDTDSQNEARFQNRNFVEEISFSANQVGTVVTRSCGISSINSDNINIGSIYAPTTSGTAGQILQSNGAFSAPTWIDNISVDSELSETSTNPVQNNIITAGLHQIEEYLPLLNDTEFKAFAITSKTQTSSFLFDGAITTIDFWQCSKYNTLSVGDKILCFLTAYRSNENRQISGLFACTITNVGTYSYNVSSVCMDLGFEAPPNYPRFLALLTDLPTTLAELSEDSTHRLVTDIEKATWNAKSEFSGSYNDLTDKPTIPTDNSQLTNGAGYVTQTEVNTTINTKTAVTVNGELQQNLNFASDPQEQLDSKVSETGAVFIDDVLFKSSVTSTESLPYYGGIRIVPSDSAVSNIPRIIFYKNNSNPIELRNVRIDNEYFGEECLYSTGPLYANTGLFTGLYNPSTGRDLTKLHADYDTGWFSYSKATTYTFTHNLNTTEFFTIIDMKNSVGDIYTQNTMINPDGTSNSYAGGLNETARTSTKIWLRGAKNYAMALSSYASSSGTSGSDWDDNNCRARVRLFKIV